jgi:hypothetical protein
MKGWQKNLLKIILLLVLSCLIGYFFRPYSIIFLTGAWGVIGGAYLLVYVILKIVDAYYKNREEKE